MSLFVFNYVLNYERSTLGACSLFSLIKMGKNKIGKGENLHGFSQLNLIKACFKFIVSGLSGAHYINKAAINGWCSD